MHKDEIDLRVRIARNAFRLRLRKITISESHVSFPWFTLIWHIIKYSAAYLWQSWKK